LKTEQPKAGGDAAKEQAGCGGPGDALVEALRKSGLSDEQIEHVLAELATEAARLDPTARVEKAGEIIPQVIEVVTSARTGREKKFSMPKKCPVCGSAVVREAEEAATRCINAACTAQLPSTPDPTTALRTRAPAALWDLALALHPDPKHPPHIL
jgi:hypothetical protein